jgi:transposase
LRVKHSDKDIGEMNKHSNEFKLEAMQMALSSGWLHELVAADLEIGKSMLAKWLADHRLGDLVTVPQAELALENERLHLENRMQREERDILKNLSWRAERG